MLLTKYKDFHDYGLPYNLTNTENNPSNLTQTERMMKNIEYLYQKMDHCTRNVTYFDLYKFSRVITEASQLQAEINALEPFTAAIINTNIDTGNGVVYAPGDIIVKNIDNTSSVIRAQRGGIFYPSSIKRTEQANNYTYDIQFSFQSAAPGVELVSIKDEYTTEEDDNNNITIVSGSDNVWDKYDNEGKDVYAQKIIFQGLAGNSVGSPYNYVYDSVADTNERYSKFTPQFKDTTPIPPIIHCYAGKEEIYIDQQINYSEDTDKYQITFASCSLCDKVVIK